MKNLFKILTLTFGFTFVMLTLNGCQDLDHPEIGDYPTDVANIPDGPLRFFVPFDGVGDELRFRFAETLSGYPCYTPDKSISYQAGISGNAFKAGNKGTFLKYLNANDFADKAQSFSVSFWEKNDGQTQNNVGGNGPEYIFSIPSSNGHWSGGQAMLMFEGNNANCAVKFVLIDKNMSDTWLVWEGGNSVSGLLDNEWHHCVFVYDASTSKLTFYKDGVANAHTPNWGTHGNLNMNSSTISSFRIGCGPGNNFNTDDWLSSTWKGGIDQFRMYATALTQTEVTELFSDHK